MDSKEFEALLDSQQHKARQDLQAQFPALPEGVCRALVGATMDSMMTVLAVQTMEKKAKVRILRTDGVVQNWVVTWKNVLGHFLSEEDMKRALLFVRPLGIKLASAAFAFSATGFIDPRIFELGETEAQLVAKMAQALFLEDETEPCTDPDCEVHGGFDREKKSPTEAFFEMLRPKKKEEVN